MKHIAIVGAGQAGLQLGLELLRQGRTVTLYTDKTAAQVLAAPTQPVALQFAPTLQFEADLGLDFWHANEASRVEKFVMNIFTPAGDRMFTIRTDLAPHAQAIDLRLKFSRWMEEFVRRGGELVVARADLDLLESAAATHDAVFVTAGRDAFGDLFQRDAGRSGLDRPYRKLALFYATGCTLDGDHPAERRVNACNSIAEVGECLFYSFMYRDGTPAYVVLFEPVPGSPLDLHDERRSIAGNFDAFREYLRDACPEVHAALADAQVIDDEFLHGAITPVVKHPVGRLPSGRVVMALGDALAVHDPVCAQGLNAASRAAHHVAGAIAAEPAASFDAAWIDRVFAAYWPTAEGGYQMTNDLITGLKPHQAMALYAASQVPELAADVLNNTGRLEHVYAWLKDAKATQAHLASRGFVMPEAA